MGFQWPSIGWSCQLPGNTRATVGKPPSHRCERMGFQWPSIGWLCQLPGNTRATIAAHSVPRSICPGMRHAACGMCPMHDLQPTHCTPGALVTTRAPACAS
eukprot:361775-Chlamydomonas_euryale.AAC.19